MKNDQGVIYVSTGERYVKMAAMSARSLKVFCPNIHVHIFTDCDTASYDCFDSSTQISDPHTTYGAKVDFFSASPFQKTLYLDGDTRVCEDISPMFDLLDNYEFAVAYDPGRGKYLKNYIGLTPSERDKPEKLFVSQAPASFMPVNSGVILYKLTDPVIEFFKTWKNHFHKEGLQADQYTLRDQLWLRDLKLLILPPEYNCRPRSHIKVLKKANITPKILHLNDFKREAGIPPIDSLSLRKKIKHIIKYRVLPSIRKIFLGSPY